MSIAWLYLVAVGLVAALFLVRWYRSLGRPDSDFTGDQL